VGRPRRRGARWQHRRWLLRLLTSIWARRRLRLLVAAPVRAAPAFALLVEGAMNSDSYSLNWCYG
jgi:hypothetical protein